eukprot:jgi/Ulvmu1/10791/UM069_0025.1
MDFLREYGNASESSGDEGTAAPSFMPKQAISAAPAVDTAGLILNDDGDPVSAAAAAAQVAANIGTRTLKYNPTLDELQQAKGGAHAADTTEALRNHRSGFVEDMAVPGAVFDMQYNEFNSKGVAEAPDRSLFGDLSAAQSAGAKRARSDEEAAAERAAREAKKQQRAEAREAAAAAAQRGGAWRLTAVQPWAGKEVAPAELTEEQKEYIAKMAAEKEAREGAKKKTDAEPTTIWHGPEGKEGNAEGWVEAPKGIPRHTPDLCYLPQKWLHTWGADGGGHKKGVNAISWFPRTAHLLASAGLDGRVKLWDVYGSRKCRRTYDGHALGVRALTFTADGSRFISTAYDKQMRLWDTETGQVIRTIRHNTMFYCATLHPDPAKQNVLLAGAADKRVYQFDLDSGDMVQEYHYHLGPVNTITFIEEGRMFVSTSDDKTLRVWELGVPVQVKYIADPSMHSMPAVGEHPNGKALCYQSLDNQIVTYTTAGRFRQNRKKTFKGHLIAGNACQVGFSPDGKYIMSGGGGGKLHFWEWSHPHRVVRTIPAHDKAVCIGAIWHPFETSRVATCGWDGLIKLWG